MRYLHIIVYFLVVSTCLSACTSGSRSSESESTSHALPEDHLSVDASTVKALYTAKGLLGENTPIELSLNFYKGFCFGQLQYSEVGTPIPVVGSHNEYKNYTLYEFAAGTEEASGRLDLEVINAKDEVTITGNWHVGEKSYSVQMVPVPVHAITLYTSERPKMGTYSATLSEQGPSGTLELYKDQDSFKLKATLLSYVNSEGVPNIGTIEETLVEQGDAWVLQKTGNNFDCHQPFYFVDDYVFVEHLAHNCGFGHRVGFTDFYRIQAKQ